MDFKKCPFCGGESELFIKPWPETASSWNITAIVKCPECAITMAIEDRISSHRDGMISFTVVQSIAEQLASMWNRRSE